MKLILALALTLGSMSVFAKSLEETVKEIEATENAKCTYLSTSFGLCFGAFVGGPATCFYSVKYNCDADDGDFQIKVKMKDVMGTKKVRKVVYKY